MRKESLKSRFHLLLFAVIPLSLFASGWLYIRNSGLYFLHSVDPEYGYLLNGLLLACLKPDIQFITNPGVPVHFIVAVVLRIVHFFRQGQPLIDDVLTNPELYIKSTLYTINVLNVLIVYLLGYTAYRYTKRIMISVFLQLLAFTNLLTLEALGRLIPESLMIIIISCWLIVLMRLIYKEERNRNYHGYSLIFGLLFSIGLADKLTFLPFFILPLIVLPGWKYKLGFAGYSLLFFLIVAFPVFLHYHFFTSWITDMITHTGAYGSGDPGFIKWQEFADRLVPLIRNTPVLLCSVIVLILSTILYYLVRRRTDMNKLLIKINAALFAVVILQYFITTKQFAFHYMIPSILLTTFIILMIVETWNAVFKLTKKKTSNLLLILLSLLIILNIIPQMHSQLKQMKTVNKGRIEALNKLKSYMLARPEIISPSYYGCSAIEYALTYGIQVSGSYAGFLYKSFNRNYPSTYMYFPWGKTFYQGSNETDPSAFIDPSLTYTLYIAGYTPEKLDEILGRLKTDSAKYTVDISERIHLPLSAESVFTLRFINKDRSELLLKNVP